MNELIFILSLVVLAGAIVTNVKNKRREVKLNQTLNHFHDITKAKLEAKIKELNETAVWLDGQISNFIELKKGQEQILEERFQMVQERHIRNNQTAKAVKDLIRDNKAQQFYVQEASLLLYNHYKSMSEILAGMINNEPKYEELFNLQATSEHNKIFMHDYFVRYFGMTPEDYKNQKIHLTGVDKQGRTRSSDFSKN